MKIDTNRVAAYLAGNFPPYYKAYSKIKFIDLLSSKAASYFVTNNKFELIERHTNTLQSFYSEALGLLEKEPLLLTEIIGDLQVPPDAKGVDFIVPHVVKNKAVNTETKTIGFITPFDDEQKEIQKIIQDLLDKDFSGWKIEISSLEKGSDGNFLWDNINKFLEKHPVYIVDFRNNNLNVAIELGAVLKAKKPYVIVNEGELPNDIKGLIYVKKPKITLGQKEVGIEKSRTKFKELLAEQLSGYLN